MIIVLIFQFSGFRISKFSNINNVRIQSKVCRVGGETANSYREIRGSDEVVQVVRKVEDAILSSNFK
jgi:hypothetical protein